MPNFVFVKMRKILLIKKEIQRTCNDAKCTLMKIRILAICVLFETAFVEFACLRIAQKCQRQKIGHANMQIMYVKKMIDC